MASDGFHVAGDLGPQCVGGVELLLLAQPRAELQTKLAAVEVCVRRRVKQMGLDPSFNLFLRAGEGGRGADADGGQPLARGGG